MTEASLLFDGDLLEGEVDAPGVCRNSEFRATPSSLVQSENEASKTTVVAAPKLRKPSGVRSSRNSRKSDLEDQMEERMHASIETRFSSFEEKMLGLLLDYQRRQNPVVPSSLATACATFSSVQCNTSGVCQPAVSRTHSENGQRNFISLDNSLNDELLNPVRHRIPKSTECTEPAHSSDVDDEQDDAILLQPGQAETRDLDLDAQSIISEHNELQAQQVDDRFLKYKTGSPSEETQQVLLDMFGEDACVKKIRLRYRSDFG